MNRLRQALCCVLVLSCLTAAWAAPPAIPPGPPAPRPTPRLQLVATRGLVNTGLSPSASTYTRNDVRQAMYIGGQPVSQLQIAFGGFYAGGGDIGIPNSITIAAAIESLSPALTKRAYFDGQFSRSIWTFAPIILSDPIPVDFLPGTQIEYRGSLIVASAGQQWPGGAAFSVAGDARFDSTSATDQVTGTGNMTQPAGGASNTTGYVPLGILGIPAQRFPAVCIMGDSLTAGSNGEDESGADQHGNYGYVARGLYLGDANGYPVPYANLSRGGEKASDVAGNAGATRRGMLQYCTHVFEGYGTNDIGGGRTLAQLQADKLRLWQTFRANSLKIYVANLLPRTTDATNTTPVAGFAPGGLRDQYNTWLLTQVGVTIDGVIDVASVVEDPANHGHWLSGETADGIHPNSATYAAIAVARIQPWAATLRISN